jgi:hypothetical protein
MGAFAKIFEITVKMIATPIAIMLWIIAATTLFNIALFFSIFISYLLINSLATLSSLLPIIS